MDEKEYTLDDAYISLDGDNIKWSDSDDIMKQSVIGDDFHLLKRLPESNKKKNKKQVEKELPEEVQKDLQVLKMRDVFDSKRFYKRNASKGIQNNIQVGVVLDSPTDFYHSRLPKKMRKNTLVDELLADAKFKKDVKRRYVQIIEHSKNRYKKKRKLLAIRNKSKNKKQS